MFLVESGRRDRLAIILESGDRQFPLQVERIVGLNDRMQVGAGVECIYRREQ